MMGVFSETDCKIIEAFAKNNMKRNQTAADVFFSPHTVDYHVKKIHRVTGLDPRNFYDLIKLLKKCGAWRE